MTDPLLQLDSVSKRFGNFTAVDDVSFTIDRDEGITALIGPNGAGKTTLYNTIGGQLQPTEGTIRFKGEDVTTLSARKRVREGIGRSFQITNIFDGLTVRQNLRGPVIVQSEDALNPLDRVTDNESANERADELLDLLDLHDVAGVKCNELSYGDRRRVDIGIALATDPDLLLLDEPTAGTAPSETREVIDLIQHLQRETDTSFLIVEHDMNVVFSIAPRILVLHRGRILADSTPEGIRADDEVQTAYLGDHGSDVEPVRRDADASATVESSARGADPLLSVNDIHTYYGQSHVLNGVSLSVERGEISALLGRNGAGKTTTLRSILGLTPPRTGTIEFDGERVDERPPHEVARLGIGVVPQERNVFTDLSVEDNLKIVEADESKWDLERIYDIFPRLGERRTQRAGTMSGGEQQMLAIARALVTDPKLLILDEPSEGLAPVIIDDLEDILGDIADEDITVLMTEQNLQFAASLADHSYLIDKGHVEWEGPMATLLASEELIGRYLTLSEVESP